MGLAPLMFDRLAAAKEYEEMAVHNLMDCIECGSCAYICPANRPLADFLPTLTIAAKNLATEMTNYNVESNDLHGELSITQEHVQNNQTVRDMLGQRGIKPEELPAAEDIKKLERKVSRDEKNIEKDSQKLPKNKG